MSIPHAKDLTREFPRSPREMLAGYVIAARMLDKCRATINGTNGDYHFDCPLDNVFLGFTGIGAEAFKAFVETGPDDGAVRKWIQEQAEARPQEEVVRWNNEWRDKRISELPADAQVFLEDYIPQHVLPKGRIPYVWFDIYDIEEGRL